MRQMKHSSRLRRGALGTALAATAALVTLPAAQAPAAAAETPLSQGRTATASSAENAGTPASGAVDGDLGTRWSSAASDDQWLQVDLGATASVSRVVLNWEAAHGKDYKIQFSGNGSTWTDARTVTGSDGGVDTVDVSGQARYVRMQGLDRATEWGYSLWEFQVFGTNGSGPAGCGTANAAQGRPASASSTENAGTPPPPRSTVTPAPAGRARPPTRSGCASTWAPYASCAGWTSTGRPPTARTSGSRRPPTDRTGRPSSPSPGRPGAGPPTR
ncbi:hypothetical protein SHKM778_51870 [Streptomyces sp. KM77-8]|uniref:F5/8 type C domain-containing protein n=1 Tax=Streptomyces haneummycinicus TaxID=3074435 RepID=A0AAT9HN91_9ACTN